MPVEPTTECSERSTCALNVAIEEIVAEFEGVTDWEDRYQVLLEMGEDMPELAEDLKTDANQVDGCLSRAWLVAQREPGEPSVFRFLADSDSEIVRGLLAILLQILSGRTAREILACDVHCVFARLQFDRHLSANRRNGLSAAVRRIQALARDHAPGVEP